MPNHWHLALWPTEEQASTISKLMHWVTMTHTQRWHKTKGTTGTGPLYQGRFKAIEVEDNENLLTLLAYINRNPLKAGLVSRAEDWRWGSIYTRAHNLDSWLCRWPVKRPPEWSAIVNEEL